MQRAHNVLLNKGPVRPTAQRRKPVRLLLVIKGSSPTALWQCSRCLHRVLGNTPRTKWAAMCALSDSRVGLRTAGGFATRIGGQEQCGDCLPQHCFPRDPLFHLRCNVLRASDGSLQHSNAVWLHTASPDSHDPQHGSLEYLVQGSTRACPQKKYTSSRNAHNCSPST